MANCVTGDDLQDAADFQKDAMIRNAVANAAVSIVLALWQRNARKSIIGMQEDISKRKQKLADNIHHHAKQFWPYQKALVEDVFAEAEHDPQYDAMGLEWRQIAKEEMNAGRSDWLHEMHRRCLNPTRCQDARWRREDQKTRTDAISFADRNAENRAEALNDQRYARQYAALGLGKNVINNIAAYYQLYSQAGGAAAHLTANTIRSGVEALGYALETPDPRPDDWGWSDTQQAWKFENQIYRANHGGDNRHHATGSGAPSVVRNAT